MFSARWSPDGRYIAALWDDSSRLFLYSFESSKWTELPSPKKGVVPSWPSWSHDSRYLYVIGDLIYKLRVPDGHAEPVRRPVWTPITCPQFHSGWFGLTPDDRILVLRDRGTDELYALDFQYR